jgi:hypothetical protein
MYLTIEGDHLIVRMNGAIDGFAPDATSFTIENWSMVNEFWPSKAPVSALQAAPSAPETTPEPAKPAATKRKRAQRDLCEVVARELWPPDGKPPEEMSNQDVINELSIKLKNRYKELKITVAVEPSATTKLRTVRRRSD